MTAPHDSREAVERDADWLEDYGRCGQATEVETALTEAAAMLRRLHARAVEAEAEAKELQRTFNLRWKADMRGIKRWQDATGRTLTWPNRADAVVFLLEKLDAAETALTEAAALLRALLRERDEARAQSRMWQEACGEHGGRYWEARCRDAEAARDAAEAALATARADALREAAAEFPDRVRWFSPEETRSIILALIEQEPRHD